MTVEDMHYDFSIKMDMVDNGSNRTFLIPEIDWYLNEAQSVFILKIIRPKERSTDFDYTQEMRDSLWPIIKDGVMLPVNGNIAPIPNDYMAYINSVAKISKGECKSESATIIVRHHNDSFNDDPFNKSSFEWREVNAVFTDNGIRLFDDGTFSIDGIMLSYVRIPEYIHFAMGYSDDGYELPSGKSLTGKQNCILPESVHRHIVDIAVALASGSIKTDNLDFATSKLTLDQL